MRKLFALALATTMALSLVSCSSSTTEPSSSSSSTPSSSSASSSSSSSATAEKEAWKPEGTVSLMCPFGAGGGTDVTLRMLAEILSDQTGATVTVLNRGGGAGAVGTGEFALAEPDGYTLGMSCNSFFSTQPFLNDVTYSLDDFIPFIGLNAEPNMLVVRGDAPYDTLEEMVDYYKDSGETVLFSHSGNAGIGHLGQLFFYEAAGIPCESIPGTSGSEGVTFVLGGHVTSATTSMAESTALFQSGDIKPLATIDTQRIPIEGYDDVPTLIECGYDVSLAIWKFMALPADTPDEIVDYWYNQFAKAYEDPRWIDFVTNNTIITNGELTYDTIMERLVPEIEATHKLLSDAGMAIN